MRKAKKAMGELKRARLVEGPTDLAVMDISKKVDQITADRDRLKAENDDYFDATKILGTDEIKARIQSSIKKDNDALIEAFQQIGYFEGIYKPKPAIKPVSGTSPIKVEQNKHPKRGPASLSDLV